MSSATTDASLSDFFTLPDASGLPITLPARLGPALGAELVGWLDAYARQVFMYGRSWDCVLRAINISDEVLMPQILAIDLFIAKSAHRYTGRCTATRARQHGSCSLNSMLSPLLCACSSSAIRNDLVNAARSLSQAKALHAAQSAVVTPRESLYLKGYACMLDNQLQASLHAFQSVIDLSPGDLFAVKKVQLLAFVLGGKEEMLAVVQRPAVVSACADRKFFHAMRAFALEENELFAEAGVAVARALALEPHDPWAVHVRAHLFYASGGTLDLEGSTVVPKAGDHPGHIDGTDWLEHHAKEWEQCMSFMYVHCWFHDALLRLDRDQIERTLRIFDQHVWPFAKEEDPAAATDTAPEVASAAASASSPASTALSHLDLPGESSFGVPCTALSFQRNDRYYVEDQNGALNLMWRMELRVAGVGRAPPEAKEQEAAAGDKREAAQSGGASRSVDGAEKKQRLDSAAAASSASASVSSSRFPLHHAAFDSRWHSIAACLTLPPTQGLSLFGLLQLYALCRCGRLPEAKQVVDLYTADVGAVADASRREALEGQGGTRSERTEPKQDVPPSAAAALCDPASHACPLCFVCVPALSLCVCSPPSCSTPHRPRNLCVPLRVQCSGGCACSVVADASVVGSRTGVYIGFGG